MLIELYFCKTILSRVLTLTITEGHKLKKHSKKKNFLFIYATLYLFLHMETWILAHVERLKFSMKSIPLFWPWISLKVTGLKKCKNHIFFSECKCATPINVAFGMHIEYSILHKMYYFVLTFEAINKIYYFVWTSSVLL